MKRAAWWLGCILRGGVMGLLLAIAIVSLLASLGGEGFRYERF